MKTLKKKVIEKILINFVIFLQKEYLLDVKIRDVEMFMENHSLTEMQK